MAKIFYFCLAFCIFVSPPYGLGIFGDFLIPTGTGTRLTLLDAFVILFLPIVLFQRGWRFDKFENRILFASFVIILSRVLSFSNIETDDIFGKILSIFRYLETPAIIYVISSFSSDHKKAKIFIRYLLFFTTLEATLSIFKNITSGDRAITFSITNLYLQGLFLSYLLNESVTKPFKLIRFLLISVFVGGLLASQTRSIVVVSMISCALSLAVILSSNKSFRYSKLVILTLVSGVTFVLFGSILLDKFENRFLLLFSLEGEGHTVERLFLWSQAFGAFLEHPLTGIGSGSFGRLQQFAFDVPYWAQPNYSGDPGQLVGLSTHSTLMNVIAETGIIGIIAYLFWFWYVLSICIFCLRLRIHSGAQPFLVAIAVFVAVNTCLDIVIPFSFQIPSSVMIGILLGLVKQHSSSQYSVRTPPIRDQTHFREGLNAAGGAVRSR